MNLQGDFEGSFLTMILQLLSDDHKTGILRVTSDGKVCKVFFQEGEIVHAQSSEKSTRIGQLLRRDGVLTEAQLKEGLNTAIEGKQAIGSVLIEKGFISKELFIQYNNRQVENVLFSILFWSRGKFAYVDAALRFTGMIIARLNPMKLILEASRRIDEMAQLSTRISSDKIVFIRTEPGKSRKTPPPSLSEEEQQILALINGARPVFDIITRSGYDAFTVYKDLDALLTYGMIAEQPEERAQPATLGSAFIVATYQELIATITTPLLAAPAGKGDAELLLREALDKLPPGQANLMRPFRPGRDAQENQLAIAEACGRTTGSPMESNMLLIGAGNALCHLLLLRAIATLDRQQVYDMVRKIDSILASVRQRPDDSMDKTKLLGEMRQVINDAMRQLHFTPAGKRQSGGLLSFFAGKDRR